MVSLGCWLAWILPHIAGISRFALSSQMSDTLLGIWSVFVDALPLDHPHSHSRETCWLPRPWSLLPVRRKHLFSIKARVPLFCRKLSPTGQLKTVHNNSTTLLNLQQRSQRLCVASSWNVTSNAKYQDDDDILDMSTKLIPLHSPSCLSSDYQQEFSSLDCKNDDECYGVSFVEISKIFVCKTRFL